MAENVKMYWLHVLTPLHVGAGQGVGFIDLPIIREKVTGWPLTPGSAVKGVISDRVDPTGEKRKKKKGEAGYDERFIGGFGRADQDGESANSGSLVFTDARLVCLPVRSLFGTFAWVTSPLALQRLKRDLDAAGLGSGLPGDCQTGDKAHLPQDLPSELKGDEDKVYLEDLDFDSQPCPPAEAWSDKLKDWIFPGDAVWLKIFKERFVILPNGSFDFLCETATEVNARIRIKQETKTVDKGALWYEESLPAESILAGLVWCDKVFPKDVATPQELLEDYCSKELALQIGGKATVGKGRVRCLFKGGQATTNAGREQGNANS
ncbi:MAG: type III-B CRISPR module RAMP protein Cmr4 [Candidatus Binatia bacterium]